MTQTLLWNAHCFIFSCTYEVCLNLSSSMRNRIAGIIQKNEVTLIVIMLTCNTTADPSVIAEVHKKNDFVLLRAKMRRLPPVNQATLKAIVEHLARVAQHQSHNKMDPHNLAIAFGGVIFGEEEIPKVENLLSMSSVKVCGSPFALASSLTHLCCRTMSWKI